LTVGTIVWTSPTGHTYTTYPGSRHLFPPLCEPTATLWTGEPPAPDTAGDRGVMMPKRRHTRTHNSAKAINAERRLNQNHAAAEHALTQPDEPWNPPAPRSNDPPPF
jgi:hypothetical protein